MSALPLAWRVHALAACGILPPLLSFVSLARLASLVGDTNHRLSSTVPPDQVQSDYIGQVLRRLPPPWHYTCLRRGIVLYHLLRRAGRPVSLSIGVRKDDGGALQAHAWLVKDGAPYLEPDVAEHRAFRVIATFPELATAS